MVNMMFGLLVLVLVAFIGVLVHGVWGRFGEAGAYDWLNFAVTTVSLVAVYLALFFKEYFVYRLYRPRLVLSVDQKHGCYHENCGCWNLRARIRNKGKTGAELAEVFFETIEHWADAGQTWVPGGAVPSNLFWSFGGAYMPHLGIGMEKYVDIATTDPDFHDVSPEVAEKFGDREWRGFRVCQQGVNKCQLPPGRYRMLLVVSASNCEAARGRLTLAVVESAPGEPKVENVDWKPLPG